MAAETTAISNAALGRAQEKTGRARQFWQAPVFVAGVALLAFVLAARFSGRPDPTRQLERDLKTVRQILDHPEGDLEAALATSRRAVDNATAQKRGEALFLLGSV